MPFGQRAREAGDGMAAEEFHSGLIECFRKTIRDHEMVAPGDRGLVAVSGGADSVALLWLLHQFRDQLGISLTVSHVNHQLRGEESDIDAESVREHADRLSLPFIGRAVDVAGSRRRGESLEMAARRERYHALWIIARESDASWVATGHTREDQVETLLLKLLRGGGPGSMVGVGYQLALDDLPLIRPLLDCSRDDLVGLLGCEQWTWREDSSNRDPSFLRNRVRHEILPYLESCVDRSLRDSWVRLVQQFMVDEAHLQTEAERHLEQEGEAELSRALPASLLREAPIALRARMIMRWLRACGVPDASFTHDLIERILSLTEGERGTKLVPVDENFLVERRYADLYVVGVNQESVLFCESIPIPGEVNIPGAGLRLVVTLSQGLPVLPETGLGVWPARGTLQFSAVGRDGLKVRNWRQGDRIRPLGLGGSIKLQDLFVNQKLPRRFRGAYPVVECRGEVVWVPGYRIAEGWQVTSPTSPSLHLEIEQQPEQHVRVGN